MPTSCKVNVHNFLQKFKQRPCVLYAWPKQGDCLSQESYVVLDSLISSAPCCSEAGFLKSQMEDQLQCGSPTYPIALYWPPAQQSTEQKILSAQKPVLFSKPNCTNSIILRRTLLSALLTIQALLFQRSARSTKPKVAGATSGLRLGCVTPCTQAQQSRNSLQQRLSALKLMHPPEVQLFGWTLLLPCQIASLQTSKHDV